MQFASFAFIGFALAAVTAFRLCGARWQREAVLCAANLVLVASFATELRELVPLLSFLALGYLAVCLAPRASSLALWVIIVAVLSLFIWLKQYFALLPSLGFAYVTVGLSYILFRVLHLVIDVAQGEATAPGPAAYFGYTTCFLAFVSGPIQRYQDFAAQLETPPVAPTSAELNASVLRIILGYVFILVFANMVQRQLPFFQSRLPSHFDDGALLTATGELTAAAFLYLVFLYVNFAGYMHIVIGIGRLAGLRLPENFNAPFHSADFLDFWSRWHITLSDWFKFYLFNPLLRVLAAHWGAAVPMPYLGALAFFVTFCTMGLWHGTTTIFLVYGLFLGCGVTVNKLWQVELARRLGRAGYRALCANLWYQDASRGAAVAYFAIALICLWIDPAWAPAFVSPGGLISLLGAFVVLTAVGMAAVRIERAFITRWEEGRVRLAAHLGRQVTTMSAAWITLLVSLILIEAILKSGDAPEFVYKGF